MFVKDEIVRKLDRLSEPKLQEALSFVEFLILNTNEVEEDPLLSVAGVLSGNAISAEEIERTLYGNEGAG